MNFYNRAKELENSMLDDRHYLHQNAELGLDLPITKAYVWKRLEEMGIEPVSVGQSGITAEIVGGKPGKTIMLRGDMDALPMTENNDLPYRTKTNAAHTCGHDIHTTMLLGAAKMLKEMQDELEGTVKLMFQPAEEIFAGAMDMINNGLLEKKIDAAFAMHMCMEEELGAIYYIKGNSTSSCDGFKITIKGKGCHGAMPELGIDPINVGVHTYLAMQELIAREVAPKETAVLTVGQFAGGTTNNIIPETVVLQGTLRTYNKELRAYLVKRLREVVEGVAKTYRATVEYEVLSAVPSNCNEPALTDEMISYINDLDYEFRYVDDYRVTPSDDFAFVSEQVPTVYINVTAKVKDNPWPLHNPGVLFDERVIPIGASIHAQCAFNWLKNNK